MEVDMQTKRDQFEQDLFRMAEEEKMILPDTVYERVNDTLVSLPDQKRVLRLTWRKSVILAAALIAMCSVTVTAAVGAWQRRMEAMNEQEMEEYFVQIYASKLGADNYNRPFTDTERTRMEELRVAYEQEAVFPKKLLTMISEPEEYNGKGVAFYRQTSTFFIPEKALSDEELLQIIDFEHKRDYSLQAVNEKIKAGEMQFPAEQVTEEKKSGMENEGESGKTDDANSNGGMVRSSGQELTVFYTGSLEIREIAAGQNCIYLLGKSCIHKMEIGSSDSELFFDDFENDTYVNALYEDKKGNIYLALSERVGDKDDNTVDNAEGVIIAGGIYRPQIWILNADGEVTKKIDLTSDAEEEYGSIRMITRMVADDQGHIYIRAAGMKDALLLVLDGQGNYVKGITSEDYYSHVLGGVGIGRDGKVYTQIQSDDRMGIASVNLQGGSLEDIYMDIVPDGTIMLDLIAPGSDTDFVFWGYDGIFTYDLGEESAVNILPAYEAPCEWDGVMYCALPDGRIVFGDCQEYRTEGEEAFSIPEKICFYYKSTHS